MQIKTIYQNNLIRLNNSEILEIMNNGERKVFIEKANNCIIISQDKELVKELKASATVYNILTYVDKKLTNLDKKIDIKVNSFLKKCLLNKENYTKIPKIDKN